MFFAYLSLSLLVHVVRVHMPENDIILQYPPPIECLSYRVDDCSLISYIQLITKHTNIVNEYFRSSRYQTLILTVNVKDITIVTDQSQFSC